MRDGLTPLFRHMIRIKRRLRKGRFSNGRFRGGGTVSEFLSKGNNRDVELRIMRGWKDDFGRNWDGFESFSGVV